MATITLDFTEQNTQEWLDNRANKYSGSNADKVLQFAQSTRVINGETTSYAKVLKEQGFTGNFSTKRGHLLEDEAIDLFEAINGIKIIRDENGVKVGSIFNSDYPDCLCSPDGLTDTHLIEVKCFNQEKHMKMYKGDIPFKIKAQVHYNMMISGKKFAYLIIYHPKLDLGQDKLNVNYAYKQIEFKANPLIFRNFKRILGGVNA